MQIGTNRFDVESQNALRSFNVLSAVGCHIDIRVTSVSETFISHDFLCQDSNFALIVFHIKGSLNDILEHRHDQMYIFRDDLRLLEHADERRKDEWVRKIVLHAVGMTRPRGREDFYELRRLTDVSLFQMIKLVMDKLFVEESREVIYEIRVVTETFEELLSDLETLSQAHFALFTDESIESCGAGLLLAIGLLKVPIELL